MKYRMDREVIMSMHRTWKTCLGIIFLLAIMCLVAQPAFAAGKSKNKGKEEKDEVTASAETPTPKSQEMETDSNQFQRAADQFRPRLVF